MSLRWRVICTAIIGVLAIAAAGLFVGLRFQATVTTGQQVTESLQPTSEKASEIVGGISDIDRLLQTYYLTSSNRDLRNYVRTTAEINRNLNEIEGIANGAIPNFSTDVELIREDLRIWQNQVADPVIAATKANDAQLGSELLTSPSSLALFKALEVETRQLQDHVLQVRRETMNELVDFTKQLGLTIAVIAALAVLGLLMVIIITNRWVLNPLDKLRRQLRDVVRKGNRHTPIYPSGPPELTRAGEDAEEMRRQLVAQIDEATAATEGLAQEGPVVTRLRQSLAPTRSYFSSTKLEIAGSLQAAEGVMAGDWWEIYDLEDGRVCLVLADVSGHGVDSAIAALRSKIVTSEAITQGKDVQEIAKSLASCFQDVSASTSTGGSSQFATALIIAVDPKSLELEWINAGHPPPIVVDADDVVATLAPTGPIMSALGGQWISKSFRLNPGNKLVAWSDGLSESRNGDGDQLDDDGVARLVLHLNKGQSAAPEELVPSVINEVRESAEQWRHDDVTLVIFEASSE